MDNRKRLQQMHMEILLLLGSIADGEKRLEKMKRDAQQMSCFVKDKIENEE